MAKKNKAVLSIATGAPLHGFSMLPHMPMGALVVKVFCPVEQLNPGGAGVLTPTRHPLLPAACPLLQWGGKHLREPTPSLPSLSPLNHRAGARKELYNDKANFSVLINGWESWEPKDKNKKNALRTYWSNEEEEMSSEKTGTQKKAWWEQEDEGYNTDSKVNTEFQWEDKTKRIINERMGVVNEDTDDDIGIEGEEDNNYEEDGEKRVDKSKENNDDKDDEDDEDKDDEDDEDDDDDDNKGHKKRHSKRNKR